jgi:hypothetical protein
MNRWHRLHPLFRRAADDDECIALSIRGLPEAEGAFEYPDIARRFRDYEGWLHHPGTMAVRFEDLMGEGAVETISAIVRHFATGPGPDRLTGTTREGIIARAIEAVDPGGSHTYRRGGGAGSWRRRFTPRHKELFKHYAGDLLVELGYERGLDW